MRKVKLVRFTFNISFLTDSKKIPKNSSTTSCKYMEGHENSVAFSRFMEGHKFNYQRHNHI